MNFSVSPLQSLTLAVIRYWYASVESITAAVDFDAITAGNNGVKDAVIKSCLLLAKIFIVETYCVSATVTNAASVVSVVKNCFHGQSGVWYKGLV
jgi:hypothetical protein